MAKNMGRPTLLTAKLQEQLCDLLAKGIPLGTASESSGVASRTVRDWLQRAETERRFSAFAAAISRARARGRVTLIERIVRADDWRAAGWLLARLAPDEFGIKASESGGDGDDPLPNVPTPPRARLVLLSNEESERAMKKMMETSASASMPVPDPLASRANESKEARCAS